MQASLRRVLMASAILLCAPAAMAQTDQNAPSTDWAAKIDALPCSVFSPERWQANRRWIEPSRTNPEGSAPFGIPYLEWTTPRWNAMKARARACGNPEVAPLVTALEALDGAQKSIAGLRIEGLRRDRERQMASNAAVSAELDNLAAMPPKQQIARLQTLSSQTSGSPLHDRVVTQLERAQNLAAEQDDAARRTAEADATGQKLAAAQQAIEQGRQEAAAHQAEIEGERAALAEQARRTEAARHEAEAATGRAAQLQQQQAALAPAQAEINRQRERDDAELRGLREQRASLEQQGRVAQEQTAQSREQVEAKSLLQRNGNKLAAMGFAPALLDGMLTFPAGNGGYRPFVTLGQFLSVLLAEPGMSLTSVSGFNGTRPGFTMKRPGAPSSAILFRPDGNELYLDSFGEGDRVSRLSDNEAMSVALALATAYQNALKGAPSAAR